MRTKPCALSYGLTKVLAGDTLIAGEGLYTTGSGTAHELVLLDKDIDFLGGWDGGTSGTISTRSILPPIGAGCQGSHAGHHD